MEHRSTSLNRHKILFKQMFTMSQRGTMVLFSASDLAAEPYAYAYVVMHAEANPYSVPPRCLCSSLRCGAYGAFWYGIS